MMLLSMKAHNGFPASDRCPRVSFPSESLLCVRVDHVRADGAWSLRDGRKVLAQGFQRFLVSVCVHAVRACAA